MSGPVRVPLADPGLTRRTPGEEFALAVAGAGGAAADGVEVPLRVSLPATFPLAATRPRYTVRHLLKTASVVGGPVPYVREPRPSGGPAAAGTTYGSTPEAGFRPTLESAGLTRLVARVPVPAGLLGEPALLAAFVDHRVVVRLCTVENEALLHGSADGVVPGLLAGDGLREEKAAGGLGAAVTAAASDVEEMGGSCDGIVAHPRDYWRMVESGLLGRLAEAGVRVSRTRMIAPGRLLLADFRAAATLLDPETSALRLVADADGPAVEAVTTVGLAVHLPQHLLLLVDA